jgi:hypothetical protein
MVSRPNCVEVKLGFDNIVLGHLQLLNIQVTTNYPLFVSGSQVVSGALMMVRKIETKTEIGITFFFNCSALSKFFRSKHKVNWFKDGMIEIIY